MSRLVQRPYADPNKRLIRANENLVAITQDASTQEFLAYKMGKAGEKQLAELQRHNARDA